MGREELYLVVCQLQEIQALPLDYTLQFNNITNWPEFKKKMDSEIGGVPIFAVNVYIVFKLLPDYESVQEIVMCKPSSNSYLSTNLSKK